MFGSRTILGLVATAAFPAFLAAQERPAIVGIASVTFKTNDVAAATQFYGHDLGLPLIPQGNRSQPLVFLVGRQTIQILPGLSGDEDRLVRITFETSDARKLLKYLAARGVKTPKAVTDAAQTRSFSVADPEGHEIGFVEFLSRPHARLAIGGSVQPISQRIIHGGFIVQDRAVEDKFFQDILGFDETWQGGPTDTAVNWVDMRVPNGIDWLEYMLNTRNPSVRTRGVMNHLALGVPDVNKAYEQLAARNAKVTEKPKIGRDGKWQLNLYDPNQTRVELMEPKPVERPCCSEMKPPRPDR